MITTRDGKNRNSSLMDWMKSAKNRIGDKIG